MISDLSRRALLLGGTGLALSACGLDLTPGGGSTKIDGTFSSAAMRGAEVGWTIAYPSGHGEGDRLPVVLSLHGRGGTHASTFSELHLDDVLDDVVKGGSPPFAIASVDGGDHSYWHRRTDGTDAAAMLHHDFLPLLDERGLDTSRLGLYGWSMGGYGALLLAGRRTRWLAPLGVAVSQPALFTAAGFTPEGAFDSPEDFHRNDVFGNPGWLKDVPLRIDCGTEDPFSPAVHRFVDVLRPKPSGGFSRGGHDTVFVRKVAAEQLRFLGSLMT